MIGESNDNKFNISSISERTKREYDFVMGIDFGTTFSGISYARTNELDDKGNANVIDISKWPGGSHYSQTPTKLLYTNGICSKWGNFRPPNDSNSEIVSLFKLHLDETKQIPIPELPDGLSVQKAISDYLKAIFEHACSELNRRFGKSLDTKKLRFCLTVPAVWTENSKEVMRATVIQAGIISKNDPQDRLLLVGEPEAAALYCETFTDEYNLKPGQNFLICDAGGGTVDLVVYRLCVDENNKNFLTEEVAGDGDMCGSTTLDSRFRTFVYYTVQRLAKNQEDLNGKELDSIVKLFADETKMQVFYPEHSEYDDDYFVVKLPDRFNDIEMERDMTYIEDSNLYIHPELLLSEIFDPVIDQVVSLVEKQLKRIKRKLDAIFLVGGFGQSACLLQKIKEKFSHEVDLICVPNRGEMAIVRGAVLMGLDPRFVKQRVIRRTYGYECSLGFDQALDPKELKSIANNGDAYCNKRFQSYALKGEIRDVDYYAYTSFKAYCNKDPILQLYAFDGDPNYLPRHTTNKKVKKVTNFVIKLPRLPNKGPGDTVIINVKFYLYQTEIKLEVEIENNIKVYTGSYKNAELYEETESDQETETNEEKEDIPILGDVGTNYQNSVMHGSKGIHKSYQTKEKKKPDRTGENDLGIQGIISEKENYFKK